MLVVEGENVTNPTRILIAAGCTVACLVAANPSIDRTAVDRIRAGNAAVARGELAAAVAHFAAAEELTTDPGLVAFNKGAASFLRGDWREAEAGFTRSLDDRACPPERRAKALYNRGSCLIRRGGLHELRAAIDSFERCLASPAADAALAADARHNLELAKLLWNEARAREKKRPTPNDPPEAPPDPPSQPDPRQDMGPGSEQPGADIAQNSTDTERTMGQPNGGQQPRTTERKTPGKGTQGVVVNGDQLPPRTPAEVTEFLTRTVAERLAKDRRSVAELVAPPERPNVKDW